MVVGGGVGGVGGGRGGGGGGGLRGGEGVGPDPPVYHTAPQEVGQRGRYN